MTVEEELEAAFEADVTIERAADARTYEGTVEFVVHCDADDEEEVRERLAELGADLAFGTTC